MSSNNASGKVVSVDAQALEQADEAAVDEEGFEVVEETSELRATVKQETQAKVDANHPDGIKETNKNGFRGRPSNKRSAFGREKRNWSESASEVKSVGRMVGQSGRETLRRSGAKSGVGSSKSGRRA
jgi:hypothetical protein